MISRDRHPQAVVARALAEATELGFEVEEVHRGHRWAIVVCTDCGAQLAVWSTLRVPEDLARRIRRFVVAHGH